MSLLVEKYLLIKVFSCIGDYIIRLIIENFEKENGYQVCYFGVGTQVELVFFA